MRDAYKKMEREAPTKEEIVARLREMFPLNSVVVPSQHAIDTGRFIRHKAKDKIVGVVVGHDEDQCIKVIIGGAKKGTFWHRLFWKLKA